jgi:small-conductance mechanosensitive channel
MDTLNKVLGDLADAAADLLTRAMTVWLPVQGGILVLCLALAGGIAALTRRRTNLVEMTMGWPLLLRAMARAVVSNLGTIIFIAATGLIRLLLERVTDPANGYVLEVAVKLATAWVVIAILASIIHNRFVKRLVAVSAWTIAALSILGLLDEVTSTLSVVAITMGGMHVTLLLILKATIFLALALWLAFVISGMLEKRLEGTTDLTPSVRVLAGKLIRLALVVIAIVVVASAIGIDLSALALFSGAVGVGVGLGLQKIVANFVSGVILLIDKSVKPGDVISVDDSFGRVVSMGTRYLVVTRRDGREILIPNEDLITHKVINWSYSKNEIRLDIPFPVDVGSDPHHVRRVALEAAASVARVLADPAPVCHFVNFSNQSLDFLLRVWIKDPESGITNMKSALLLALWDAMAREQIMIPSPIADMRLRGTAKLAVQTLDDLPSEKRPSRREQIP